MFRSWAEQILEGVRPGIFFAARYLLPERLSCGRMIIPCLWIVFPDNFHPSVQKNPFILRYLMEVGVYFIY
jgi:hypothetical protein